MTMYQRPFVCLTLLALTGLANAGSVSASLPMERCAQHLPYGIPQTRRQDTTLICRPGYALEYDNKAKIPLWVAYVLTPEHAVGCEGRDPGFDPDPSVPPGASATGKDYAKSGYDIGHLANSNDMRWSVQASIDSNVFSNAAPQLPGLNRGAWKALEIRTRSWALERPVQVVVGTIRRPAKAPTTIGPGGVVVPSAFFKVLIDPAARSGVPYIYPQAPSTARPAQFVSSMAEVQRQANIVIPAPGITFLKAPWPINASSVRQKADTCKTG